MKVDQDEGKDDQGDEDNPEESAEDNPAEDADDEENESAEVRRPVNACTALLDALKEPLSSPDLAARVRTTGIAGARSNRSELRRGSRCGRSRTSSR